MTILFESPNVFYAVIDGVNIRIENYQLLPIIIGHNGFDSFKTKTQEVLNPGDIFQVEGFEYDHKWINPCIPHKKCLNESDGLEICKQGCKKLHLVAILKLAKEEEPKEHCMYKSCCQDGSCDLCSNEKDPDPLHKNAPVLKTYSDTDGLINNYMNIIRYAIKGIEHLGYNAFEEIEKLKK